MKKTVVALLVSLFPALTDALALQTTPPVDPIVTYRIEGEVTSAVYTGDWTGLADHGITIGTAWYGFLSYDISAVDRDNAPDTGLYSAGAGVYPPLQIWIGSHPFKMDNFFDDEVGDGMSVTTLSPDPATGLTGTSFLPHDIDHVGQVWTPWEIAAGTSMDGYIDTWSLSLEDILVSTTLPDGLPYDMEFGDTGSGQMQLGAVLSTGGPPTSNARLEFELSINQLELVPEPTTLSLLGLGTLALLMMRRKR